MDLRNLVEWWLLILAIPHIEMSGEVGFTEPWSQIVVSGNASFDEREIVDALRRD